MRTHPPRSQTASCTRGSRLFTACLLAFALGAAPGARAQTAVASLHPLDAATADPSTALQAIHAALGSEARSLGAKLRAALVDAISEAEVQQGIPAFLILAVIAQESGFDPDAEGVRGAIGLMQLRPFVAADYARRRGLPWKGEKTLRDPVRNVELAAGYLGELLDRFGSVDLALEAYNKGPEYVKRKLRAGEDGPTARFVTEVLTRYQRYTSRYLGS
jgi:soluble lytic murein transglycosylase-like protein